MVLLQTDLTQSVLPVTAVVGIIIFISGLIATWFKMISNKEKMGIRIDQLEKEAKEKSDSHKEENLGLKNSIRNTKKEMEATLKEQIQITHARIDRVRDDNIKSYEKLEKRIDELDKKGDEHTSKILEAIKSAKNK
jgi:uncharacterized protein YlxW (UPF0749 family)